MRPYNKTVEKGIALIVKDYQGEFVPPISPNYPQMCSGRETLLYGFLRRLGRPPIADLVAGAEMGPAEYLTTQYQTTCIDTSDPKRRSCPCFVHVEPYRFKYKAMTVLILWDHGYAATSQWKWWMGKQVYFSRYRLKMYHSDRSEIDVSALSDEKISHMLETLYADLNVKKQEIEAKHKKELDEI